MKKVLWIVRIIFGMSCAVATLGGVIMSVQDPVPENILLTVVCIVLAVLLLKKRKRKEPEVLRTSETSTPLVSVKTELTQPDVPEDTLRDMRKYYSTMQAENDARIMRESFQLCQQTFAYETFFSRLQLAERKALTLLQAKKPGAKWMSRCSKQQRVCFRQWMLSRRISWGVFIPRKQQRLCA